MSALSHNNAVRKLLHVAAVLATFACVSGATLVVSATTSPVMAQDITGTDQAQKIDQLQHAFDPAHYPKKDPPPPPPPPPPEKSWWEKCIDWLCGASDEEIKKQHDADLKKAVEERRKELGSEKKTEAPKPETKTSESRVTGFVKPVETVKASAIKVPATSKVETVRPATSLKAEASHFEAVKAPAIKPAMTQTKPVTTMPAAHALPAMTMPVRSASATLIRR